MDNGDCVRPERGVSEPEDKEAEPDGGSQDLLDVDRRSKGRWRESMPEGERWRDDVIELQQVEKEDGSQADDEKEDELEWNSEKAALGLTPQVTIVRQSCKELPEESRLVIEKEEKEEPQTEPDPAAQFYPEWAEDNDNLCEVVLATVAAGILFPLLVWAGYALLPFDPPLLQGAPLRVVYTLRCSFFAIIPILLGMVVLGAARLRYSSLSPLYQAKLVNRDVAVHWHFINESLALFLFFFLQLAVMATYVSQDLVKLVPLLTIVFVFGRLIYWLCLSLGGSSIRGLGFGLSFLPILTMLGVNLYYVCSSVGSEAVFDVGPPATPPPPPRQLWWG
uniref:Uncharacterized protein n=1 Tax=Mola mola TaxID=94237 RepID=A0A3Q4BQX0_MOLML